MAEIARSELALHPIHGLLKATHSHDPGVIDEDVKSVYEAVDFGGCFTHRCVIGEVALDEGDIDLGIDLVDLVYDRVYFDPVAASEQKPAGIGARQSLCNLSTDAVFAWTGDED